MKTAIIISDGLKQIMFTPETESEKMALKMITPQDDINVDIKWGTLFNTPPPSAMGYVVQKSRGEYLRALDCEDSLMLVLTPKKEKENA